MRYAEIRFCVVSLFHVDPVLTNLLFVLQQQELKYLCFLVEEGRIKPKVAEKVTIEEVPDAQR
jgi:hypothetical protein